MTTIFWKGAHRTLDDLAASVESLCIPGQPILSPPPSSDVSDGDGTPAIVSGNAPSVGDPTRVGVARAREFAEVLQVSVEARAHA